MINRMRRDFKAIGDLKYITGFKILTGPTSKTSKIVCSEADQSWTVSKTWEFNFVN